MAQHDNYLNLRTANTSIEIAKFGRQDNQQMKEIAELSRNDNLQMKKIAQLSHNDNLQMKEISLAAQRDSSDMRAIAVLTLIFLPATFVAVGYLITYETGY